VLTERLVEVLDGGVGRPGRPAPTETISQHSPVIAHFVRCLFLAGACIRQESFDRVLTANLCM